MSELDLKALWNSGERPDEPHIDIAALEARGAGFERATRRRNLMEWGACVVVVFWVGHDALNSANALQLSGRLLVIAAAIGCSIYLYLRGRVMNAVNPEDDTRAFLESTAASLEKQANLLATVPLWYLTPFGIGIMLQLMGTLPPDRFASGTWWGVVTLVIIVFVIIGWFNLRRARALQEEANALRAELT